MSLEIAPHRIPTKSATAPARDRLKTFLAGRVVHCEDKGADRVYPKRRIGVCQIDGEATTLNQWLVREGWALNFEPYAKGRFATDEEQAKASHVGLWKGCFATPQDLRRWNKSTAKLLGEGCSTIRDIDARNALFPDDPSMPPGCSIKGKFAVRAKLTGHRGIYHLEGCGSYQRTKKPDRWFCSEEDAQAAGFPQGTYLSILTVQAVWASPDFTGLNLPWA
jgi:hypothetical protein